MRYTQWQWRNRGSQRPWEDIERPECFWLQMEYRRMRRRTTSKETS